MVKEIRIYVEGGGSHRSTTVPFREGFDAFLRELKAGAQAKRLGWRLIPCGGRDNTLDDFGVAVRANPDALNILLIDAEESASDGLWRRLRARLPAGTGDDRCHLMVQAMEAWLIADIPALEREYGAGFNARALPRNPNVEAIEKDRLEPALKQATRGTRRGEYRKVPDGPNLLKVVDAVRVRTAAAHCDRLFGTLRAAIDGA